MPDVGGLLPDLGSGFLDSYAASLTTQLGAKASDVAGNLAALEAMLDAASSEADAAALQSVQGWVRDQEGGSGSPDWEPTEKAVGLVKVEHADGSLWVSPARADDYRSRGRAALAVAV